MMQQRLQRFVFAAMAFLILSGAPAILHAQTWGDGMYHNGMQQMMWGGQLPPVTATGNVILGSPSFNGMMDTSMSHLLYFIDSSGNGIKTYQLFFGPYWYNPPSGAQRPQSGQSVTVHGGLYTGVVPPVIAVYQINGQVWRDSTGAPPWGGHWVRRSSADSTRVYCGNDSLSWISMPPGAMGTGMMGGGMMMWPDSMYMTLDQMLDTLPFMAHGRASMGFHMIAFAPTGISMMQGGMMGGQGMMGLVRPMYMHIHVSPDSLVHHGLLLSQMRLMFFDTDSTWKEVSGQTQDPQSSAIIASIANAVPYLAVTTAGATSVGEDDAGVPLVYSLEQNWPNPWNPSTTIGYTVGGIGDQGSGIRNVKLTIYNVLGQEVATLVNEKQAPGKYSVRFDGRGLASGIYLYRLQAGSYVETKKMLLIR